VIRPRDGVAAVIQRGDRRVSEQHGGRAVAHRDAGTWITCPVEYGESNDGRVRIRFHEDDTKSVGTNRNRVPTLTEIARPPRSGSANRECVGHPTGLAAKIRPGARTVVAFFGAAAGGVADTVSAISGCQGWSPSYSSGRRGRAHAARPAGPRGATHMAVAHCNATDIQRTAGREQRCSVSVPVSCCARGTARRAVMIRRRMVWRRSTAQRDARQAPGRIKSAAIQRSIPMSHLARALLTLGGAPQRCTAITTAVTQAGLVPALHTGVYTPHYSIATTKRDSRNGSTYVITVSRSTHTLVATCPSPVVFPNTRKPAPDGLRPRVRRPTLTRSSLGVLRRLRKSSTTANRDACREDG
jgi:hypothetical protein